MLFASVPRMLQYTGTAAVGVEVAAACHSVVAAAAAAGFPIPTMEWPHKLRHILLLYVYRK